MSLGLLTEDDPQMRQVRGEIAAAGAQGRVTVSGAAMKLHEARAGRQTEEVVDAVAACFNTQTALGGMGVLQQLQCRVSPLVIAHAPVGQADAMVAAGPRLITVANDPG